MHLLDEGKHDIKIGDPVRVDFGLGDPPVDGTVTYFRKIDGVLVFTVAGPWGPIQASQHFVEKREKTEKDQPRQHIFPRNHPTRGYSWGRQKFKRFRWQGTADREKDR